MMKKLKKDHKTEQGLDTANTKIKVPIGAKLIAVLYALLGGLAAVASFFALGYVLAKKLPADQMNPILAVIFSVIGIIFAIIIFFIALGIWNGKNWARISIATFNCMYVFLMVITIDGPSGDMRWKALFIVIAAVIAIYLLMSKEVKSSFR